MPETKGGAKKKIDKMVLVPTRERLPRVAKAPIEEKRAAAAIAAEKRKLAKEARERESKKALYAKNDSSLARHASRALAAISPKRDVPERNPFLLDKNPKGWTSSSSSQHAGPSKPAARSSSNNSSTKSLIKAFRRLGL